MTNAERPNYVLDSFALLAYLQDEPGATRISRLLHSANARRAFVWMSIVNLAETLYIVERKHGLEKTQETIATIDKLPLVVIDVQRPRAFSAAHIKAQHSMSFADAFAVALAKEKNASVVTGDPEFETVEKEINIEWLPLKKRE